MRVNEKIWSQQPAVLPDKMCQSALLFPVQHENRQDLRSFMAPMKQFLLLDRHTLNPIGHEHHEPIGRHTKQHVSALFRAIRKNSIARVQKQARPILHPHQVYN